VAAIELSKKSVRKFFAGILPGIVINLRHRFWIEKYR